MVDVVVLGSGTPNPDPDRAGSALAIVGSDGWVLVDCVRGATQRALAAGLDLHELVAVFLTHHHSDHLSDLSTLAIARWAAGCGEPLRVVAPSGPCIAFAEHCLDPFDDECFRLQSAPAAGPRPQIEVVAFDASDELQSVVDHHGWYVSTILVQHHPVEPAVGYRIERDRVAIAVSGDTAVCDGVRRLAVDVDVLVHEALLSSRVSGRLLEWNASARSVGELAAATGPRTLVLTHLIPAPMSNADEAAYLDEVRDGGFAGVTLVARDLLRIPVDG